MRYATLCSDFAKIAKEACTNEKVTQVVRKRMNEIKSEVVTLKASNSKKLKNIASQDNNHQSQETAIQINDPPASNPKGRPVTTRRKPGFNLQGKATKTKCKSCGSTEHTTAKCDNTLGTK